MAQKIFNVLAILYMIISSFVIFNTIEWLKNEDKKIKERIDNHVHVRELW